MPMLEPRCIFAGDMYRCADRGTHDHNGVPWGDAKFRRYEARASVDQLCPQCCHPDGAGIDVPFQFRMTPYQPLPFTKADTIKPDLGDYLLLPGPVTGPTGLDAWLPAGVTLPGSFMGVDRSCSEPALLRPALRQELWLGGASPLMQALWDTDPKVQEFVNRVAESCPGCVQCEGPPEDGDPTCPTTYASRERVSDRAWMLNEGGHRDRLHEFWKQLVEKIGHET